MAGLQAMEGVCQAAVQGGWSPGCAGELRSPLSVPECVGACTCAQHVFQELQQAQQHSTEPSSVSLVKDDTQLLHYRKK